MRVLVGSAERGPVISLAIVTGALTLLTATVFTSAGALEAAPLITLVVTAAVAYRVLLRWSSLLVLLLLVILFIPIRRYTMPGNLPFELEPYRLLVAFVLLGWIGSLLADPRVRLRRSGLEGPIGLFVFAALASVAVNPGLVSSVSSFVSKRLTFFASFILVFYFIVSVVRTRRDVDRLVRVLVAGGGVLAALAVIEGRTGYNVFNHLAGVVPLLRPEKLAWGLTDAGDTRLQAFGSAEHPIALGAALAMLVPLAAYLAKRLGERRWWFVMGVLLMGVLASRSRTAVVMLLVVFLIFLWLRPVATKRIWPVIPLALVAVPLALPGTFGSLQSAFFPEGGLIAEQRQGAGTRGSGRVADIGPSLQEFAERPLLGQGFGTRVVDPEHANARILDNQWLGAALETGLLGIAAWVWLFRRCFRRLAERAKADDSPEGWLSVALCASITAYAVGMLTFDAFSFSQATFLLFILLGFAAVSLRLRTPFERVASSGPTAVASAAGRS
jgi:O-antigen ligase